MTPFFLLEGIQRTKLFLFLTLATFSVGGRRRGADDRSGHFAVWAVSPAAENGVVGTVSSLLRITAQGAAQEEVSNYKLRRSLHGCESGRLIAFL